MNLGDELRAALSQEAAMQTAVPPNLDRLISGGQARRRRRGVTRFAAAALTLVLVGGGAYGLTRLELGDGPATEVADNARLQLPADSASAPLEPGTYRWLVGTGTDGVPIEVDVTFEDSDWNAGNFPTVSEYGVVGGLAVYRPQSIAAGSGCEADAPNADLAKTPQSLARQLAHLPKSTVVDPVTPTRLLGRDAVHLRLRISDDCPVGDIYRVAETLRGSHGVSYGTVVPTTVVIDFWVLAVDGVPVVVDAWHQVGVSAD